MMSINSKAYPLSVYIQKQKEKNKHTNEKEIIICTITYR